MIRAMSQLLCIGYGIDPPLCNVDIVMCTVSVILGMITFALFIAFVTTDSQRKDASKVAYKDKIMQVKTLMNYRNFPRFLKHRIMEYYENRFDGKDFNEGQILSELNPKLLRELTDFTCKSLIKKVPIFRFCDDEQLHALAGQMQHESYSVLKSERFLEMSCFGVKHGHLGHFWVRKRDFRTFLGQNM